MDSHGWPRVYETVLEADKEVPPSGRTKRYGDAQIVIMYLWAVAHDRPQGWGCCPDSYPEAIRPAKLPVPGHFSRRIRSLRCQHLLREVERRLAFSERSTPVSFIDARPLVVGSCSKDHHAKPGRVYGGFARGYKVHGIVTEDGRMGWWYVTPLNVSETRVGKVLVRRAPLGAWLLGDGNYDAGALYDEADRRGCQLLTPLPENAGDGHRKPSPARQRAIELWRTGVAKPIHRQRGAVERIFGNQSSFGGGLAPLPAWVRTLPRVRNWVRGKLIIYQARLLLRRQVA